MALGKAHVSPDVESWNAYRENLVNQFRFTRRTSTRILVWGVALPLALYAMFRREQGAYDTSLRGKPAAAS